MFPVLPEYVTHLSIDDIKNMTCYVKNDLDRLIETQTEIAKINLKESFKKIYQIKSYSPDDNPALANRCIDFKQAETVMLEFKLKEQFQREDIKVERSNDYSTFLITTNNDEYIYSDSILNNMYGFLNDISEKIEQENELSVENADELTI